MSVNLIETTVNISSTDLVYILEFAETVAKNFSGQLLNEFVGLDLDDEALDRIAAIVRQERRKLGNKTFQSQRMLGQLLSDALGSLVDFQFSTRSCAATQIAKRENSSLNGLAIFNIRGKIQFNFQKLICNSIGAWSLGGSGLQSTKQELILSKMGPLTKK